MPSFSSMETSIGDQVGEYFETLFDRIFGEPFRAKITERLRRKAVLRHVDESADAASQSLVRLFENFQLTPEQVGAVLGGFAELPRRIGPEEIANPNRTPESIVEELLLVLPCPESVQEAEQEPVYRVALHSIVQVLTLVGPVMAEWRKLNFAFTFELPKRVVARLNEITFQLSGHAPEGESAADERYELTYRDYLLQRFHRVEVGTVRMTTNLGVDLRELFVMPQVLGRPIPKAKDDEPSTEIRALLDLTGARKFFGDTSKTHGNDKEPRKSPKGIPALEQVKKNARNVIVGPPGSGKSTFLEWLQLKIASVEEELELGGQQAIPILLRVRQLDPKNLPRGSALIEKATASRDRAVLMPEGWLDRKMRAGCVLFMLDGLDETEPEMRDDYVFPWLVELIKDYPKCAFLVSSRPTGYPTGALRKRKFAECDLLDFDDRRINEYARHWCTAVRLARNEPEEEARREGTREGDEIVAGFKDNAYIRDLARNPLMLSAICLVNYFEGGTLPDDRAMLYRLCVEGLLHHWDQRRGIRSEFGLEEKLRVCREVALAMQLDDKAEYTADHVLHSFTTVLGDGDRAEQLLEHIRYRTGLLVERRTGVFAFAHLTFQEYLAARAVHEGNKLGVDPERLAREHEDDRWQEVIPLFCGLTPAPTASKMIEHLIAQADSLRLGAILAEAYLSSGPELVNDAGLRNGVISRVALSPDTTSFLEKNSLFRFSEEEVAPIANAQLGMIETDKKLSHAYSWLREHIHFFDWESAVDKCRQWRTCSPFQLTEFVYLLHRSAPHDTLNELAGNPRIYEAPGPVFNDSERYKTQAEIALIGLPHKESKGVPDKALLVILQTLVRFGLGSDISLSVLSFFESLSNRKYLPHNPSSWADFARHARWLTEHIDGELYENVAAHDALMTWADFLEEAIAKRGKETLKKRGKNGKRSTKKKTPKRTTKKTASPIDGLGTGKRAAKKTPKPVTKKKTVKHNIKKKTSRR